MVRKSRLVGAPPTTIDSPTQLEHPTPIAAAPPESRDPEASVNHGWLNKKHLQTIMKANIPVDRQIPHGCMVALVGLTRHLVEQHNPGNSHIPKLILVLSKLFWHRKKSGTRPKTRQKTAAQSHTPCTSRIIETPSTHKP